ncbi:MAG: hypothetical protein HGA39_09140 [Coriobacteriia bacterium]|nr:hypothetical protein [Coriobacteriia bacterium]
MMLVGADTLTENDVIEHVCCYLRSTGWEIEQRLTTRQTGDDIIARRPDGIRLYIEAKGATSALVTSKRYGRPFDQAQASVHVSEAAFRALKTISRNGSGGLDRAGIALPSNTLHRRLMEPALSAIRDLGVAIFWVQPDGEIDVACPWAVPA